MTVRVFGVFGVWCLVVDDELEVQMLDCGWWIRIGPGGGKTNEFMN